MFYIKLEEKSNKMSFKALPVKNEHCVPRADRVKIF